MTNSNKTKEQNSITNKSSVIISYNDNTVLFKTDQEQMLII